MPQFQREPPFQKKHVEGALRRIREAREDQEDWLYENYSVRGGQPRSSFTYFFRILKPKQNTRLNHFGAWSVNVKIGWILRIISLG